MDQFKKFGQLTQFKQLIVGAGTSIFKAQGAWVWGGSSTPTDAQFKIHLPTGALTTAGTINATGGVISGDLSVTGSLFSDDGSAFQTKLAQGRISFLKSNSQKAYIMTADDSASLQCATGDYFYVTKLSGIPLFRVNQNGNVEISTAGAFLRLGTRKITDTSDSITCDGYFKTTEGMVVASGKAFGVGNDGGKTGTFTDGGGNTITVKGGIITGGI